MPARLPSYVCRDCRNLLLGRQRPSPTQLSDGRRRQTRRHASTNLSPTENRPFRLGIIGSGPAGFYAAARVIQKKQDAIVDMYEKLPVPFGLVRYGVAPDHPEVKNCQDKFVEVASSPRFNYIGNVSVGDEVPLSALKPHYDALLFAYGASEDRTLGIPGEESRGVVSARAFVGWYNGLPEYADLNLDLQADDTAFVIGNGNVALDVARILLSDLEVLRKTDISEHAVEALSRSKVRKVHVCGRRGPMQAAFTIKEVRELLNLPDVGFRPIDPELLPQADYIASLPRLEQRKYRLAQLLAKGSANALDSSSKSWVLDSLLSPKEFQVSQGALKGIVLGSNEYIDSGDRFNPAARVRDTGESHTVSTKLAFRSIGYKSCSLSGLTDDLGVPFDERRGIIPNDIHGRVLSADGGPTSLTAAHVPGCYCAGWVKRGPTGVIASTMEDAFASADIIMRDWEDEAKFLNGTTKNDREGSGRGWDGVVEEESVKARGTPRRVTWADYEAIDRAEEAKGKALGKPREKFRSTREMLDVIR